MKRIFLPPRGLQGPTAGAAWQRAAELFALSHGSESLESAQCRARVARSGSSPRRGEGTKRQKGGMGMGVFFFFFLCCCCCCCCLDTWVNKTSLRGRWITICFHYLSFCFSPQRGQEAPLLQVMLKDALKETAESMLGAQDRMRFFFFDGMRWVISMKSLEFFISFIYVYIYIYILHYIIRINDINVCKLHLYKCGWM